MRKTFAAMTAAVALLASTAGFASQAEARGFRGHHHGGWGGAGIVAGLIGGALLGSAIYDGHYYGPRYRTYYYDYGPYYYGSYYYGGRRIYRHHHRHHRHW